jgi:GMP synthase (glutamine-hydrolysing)
MSRTALAIRHVAFEDLGSLGPALEARGFSVEYLDMPAPARLSRALESDLLVVLGGPIGAYEEAAYPFLADELAVLDQRLAANRPTLGICLGAQLMARALGARVYPGGRKEIGWSLLQFTMAGQNGCLKPLAAEPTPVLHWHGDTFDLPREAVLLASSELYENQAFSWGTSALALQFHAEVGKDALERWYIGHACELAAAGISVAALRADSERLADPLAARALACFNAWLDQACAQC